MSEQTSPPAGKLRFQRGDLVEVPKRLGGGRGVVAYSAMTAYGESTQVARMVGGKVRLTVIREDELYRLPS